jgi:hypothetical protein
MAVHLVSWPNVRIKLVCALMIIKFPVIICFLGAIAWFRLATKLRRFKVSEKPSASRAHLSQQERQHRIVLGSRLSFALACFFLVGGIVLFWLENSR